MTAALEALEPDLAAAPGTVSVCAGPLTGPVFSRAADAEHYAASTIKVAVLAAAHRLSERGELALDEQVAVHNDFASVVSGRFAMPQDYDSDQLPWQRLGGTAPLDWLARRMIVCSSNLATDLVLERVGYDEPAALLALAGADGVTLRRPICDDAASAAGVQNTVTAKGLFALLAALAQGRLAGAAATEQMMAVLRAQEHLEGIVSGVPDGVAVASKGGWVEGIRHDVAVVYAPSPYVLAVCTTGIDDDTDALRLVHDVAAASWTDLGGDR